VFVAGCEGVGPDPQLLETARRLREGKPGLQVVTAQSWAGIYARSAYQDYEDTGKTPGWAGRPKFPQPASVDISTSGGTPELALWARSACDGGHTYHRVSVGLDDPAPSPTYLTKRERKQLSKDVRSVLDRYLAAKSGWPHLSHCHSTELLGEVTSWKEKEGEESD